MTKQTTPPQSGGGNDETPRHPLMWKISETLLEPQDGHDVVVVAINPRERGYIDPDSLIKATAKPAQDPMPASRRKRRPALSPAEEARQDAIRRDLQDARQREAAWAAEQRRLANAEIARYSAAQAQLNKAAALQQAIEAAELTRPARVERRVEQAAQRQREEAQRQREEADAHARRKAELARQTAEFAALRHAEEQRQAVHAAGLRKTREFKVAVKVAEERLTTAQYKIQIEEAARAVALAKELEEAEDTARRAETGLHLAKRQGAKMMEEPVPEFIAALVTEHDQLTPGELAAAQRGKIVPRPPAEQPGPPILGAVRATHPEIALPPEVVDPNADTDAEEIAQNQDEFDCEISRSGGGVVGGEAEVARRWSSVLGITGEVDHDAPQTNSASNQQRKEHAVASNDTRGSNGNGNGNGATSNGSGSPVAGGSKNPRKTGTSRKTGAVRGGNGGDGNGGDNGGDGNNPGSTSSGAPGKPPRVHADRLTHTQVRRLTFGCAIVGAILSAMLIWSALHTPPEYRPPPPEPAPLATKEQPAPPLIEIVRPVVRTIPEPVQHNPRRAIEFNPPVRINRLWALNLGYLRQNDVVGSIPFTEVLRGVPAAKVIHFWATWCAPCLREIPQFRNLSGGWGRDVRFSPVHIGPITDLPAYRRLVGLMPPAVTEPLVDTSGTVLLGWLRDHGVIVDGDGIPITLVLDCRNELRWAHIGDLEDTAVLNAQLDTIRRELTTGRCIVPPTVSNTEPLPADCGDGLCSANETCNTCPADCPCVAGSVCGLPANDTHHTCMFLADDYRRR